MQHYLDLTFDFIVTTLVSLMVSAGVIMLIAELRP
jgi:hypothetical protein